MKLPLLVEVPVWPSPVLSLVTVIFALPTTAPVASVTVPAMAPVAAVCASLRAMLNNARARTITTLTPRPGACQLLDRRFSVQAIGGLGISLIESRQGMTVLLEVFPVGSAGVMG